MLKDETPLVLKRVITVPPTSSTLTYVHLHTKIKYRLVLTVFTAMLNVGSHRQRAGLISGAAMLQSCGIAIACDKSDCKHQTVITE
jgi:hypothetical protein